MKRSWRNRLALAVRDASARQIVRRKLDGDLVAGKNTDKKLSHFARYVRQYDVLILELDAKHRVPQRFDNRPVDGYSFLFRCHCTSYFAT